MNKKSVIFLSVAMLLCLLFLLIFYAPRNKQATLKKSGYYFDTYIELTVFSQKDSKYLDECLKICEKYDSLFDKTNPDSDIYKINHANGNPVIVNEETYSLISDAIKFCEETNGALDITIENVVSLWGFENKSEIVSLPNEKELENALSHVDYKTITLSENNRVSLKDPMAQIDLGCIAKGYIADRIRDYLLENNVSSAIISLGGNIVVIGNKPDGQQYTIGIKDPNNAAGIISTIDVSDCSIVTSGTYERFLTIDNIDYHHILDTNTGYPIDNGIKSVTITTYSSETADVLSTACLILGEEKSKPLLEKYNAVAEFH